MTITVNGFLYRVRTVADYAANEARKRIQQTYLRRYAPKGYFQPDGSVSLVDSPDEVVFDETQDKHIPKKIPREVQPEESEVMIRRMSHDPDYLNELLDFHCTPLGNAPLLSYLLEDHTPTVEEKLEIEKAQDFFYKSGTANNQKVEESQTPTEQESPQPTEVNPPEGS